MIVEQTVVSLRARPRGAHLISQEIDAAIAKLEPIEHGLAHLHLLHTSAALTLNENSDPDVRTDLSAIIDRLVPESQSWYRHTLEGPDDMPAHAKSSLLGASLVLPVRDGRLLLGTWQGVYLVECRDRGGSRRLCITLMGSPA